MGFLAGIIGVLLAAIAAFLGLRAWYKETKDHVYALDLAIGILGLTLALMAFELSTSLEELKDMIAQANSTQKSGESLTLTPTEAALTNRLESQLASLSAGSSTQVYQTISVPFREPDGRAPFLRLLKAGYTPELTCYFVYPWNGVEDLPAPASEHAPQFAQMQYFLADMLSLPEWQTSPLNGLRDRVRVFHIPRSTTMDQTVVVSAGRYWGMTACYRGEWGGMGHHPRPVFVRECNEPTAAAASGEDLTRWLRREALAHLRHEMRQPPPQRCPCTLLTVNFSAGLEGDLERGLVPVTNDELTRRVAFAKSWSEQYGTSDNGAGLREMDRLAEQLNNPSRITSRR